MDRDLSPDMLFERSFHELYDGLHRYAFTIVKDPEEAKDVVQKAFIKLWQKRHDVNMRQGARLYLYTAVHNLCLNVLRDHKTRTRHISQYNQSSEGLAWELMAEDKELAKQIHIAIESLPPRCREVFCKSRLEGKRYAQIADEMQLSVKTVEVQIGKALKILRGLLADSITTIVIILLRLFL